MIKIKEKLTPSQIAGRNGTHIEYCIMGKCSNPTNLIDDIDNKLEIKSCQLYHKRCNCLNDKSRRAGAFKINYEQHKFLLSIDGAYVFVVHHKGKIVMHDIVTAKQVEKELNVLTRKLTKHHYFNLNWKKIFPEVSGWETKILED